MASTINIDKRTDLVRIDFGAAIEQLLGPCFESADGSTLSFSIMDSFLACDAAGKRAAIAIFMELTMGRALEHELAGLTGTPKSLSLDFISVPGTVWVEGRAHVVRRTRNIIFLQCELACDNGIISTSTAIWSVDAII